MGLLDDEYHSCAVCRRPCTPVKILLIVLIVVCVLVVVFFVALLAAGAYAGRVFVTSNKEDCIAHFKNNTAASFELERDCQQFASFDPSPYFVDELFWEDQIDFVSRSDNKTLVGTFMWQPNHQSVPTVIVVHGFNSCSKSASVLIPSGMLWHGGYNVFTYDNRESGYSGYDDGYFSWGTDDYNDVLGAYDYLVQDRGIDPNSIAVMGISMGGAISSTAFGQEPRFRGLFVDSGVWDPKTELEYQISRILPLRIVYRMAWRVSERLSGVDFDSLTPQISFESGLNARPVYLASSWEDTYVPPREQLVPQAFFARNSSATVYTWLKSTYAPYPDVDDLPSTCTDNHVVLMIVDPVEFVGRMLNFYDHVFYGVPITYANTF